MGLFEISEEKRRAKEIKKEGKNLRKWILLSGVDKKSADAFMDEFLTCLEQGICQRDYYYAARAHMESCLKVINEILPQMRELQAEECKRHLGSLLTDLPLVFHDCFIRKDDLDYESTLRYMNKQVPVYSDNDRLMMQSELENIKAVFDDAMLWDAPNFVALAYFLRHKCSDLLSDMENSARNSYIERIYKEEFWDGCKCFLEQADALEQVEQFAVDMFAK